MAPGSDAGNQVQEIINKDTAGVGAILDLGSHQNDHQYDDKGNYSPIHRCVATRLDEPRFFAIAVW